MIEEIKNGHFGAWKQFVRKKINSPVTTILRGTQRAVSEAFSEETVVLSQNVSGTQCVGGAFNDDVSKFWSFRWKNSPEKDNNNR